mmetsp:Transcript_38188/g.74744  ORF Transcript_38188/g.74744 Transcript_38188/m.74744 type:complete len:92 (+) Transcript_38188:215-490(+)
MRTSQGAVLSFLLFPNSYFISNTVQTLSFNFSFTPSREQPYPREGPAKPAATQFLLTTLHYYIIPIPRHPRSFLPRAQNYREKNESPTRLV